MIYARMLLSACTPACQKRASDLIMDGCEPPCGFWDLNSGPSEEQSVLLPSEPSRQPPCFVIFTTGTEMKLEQTDNVY